MPDLGPDPQRVLIAAFRRSRAAFTAIELGREWPAAGPVEWRPVQVARARGREGQLRNRANTRYSHPERGLKPTGAVRESAGPGR